MRRAFFVLVIGLGGLAILISLGVWQMQRLTWKEGILADIDARIAAPPTTIPASPDPEADRYLPVTVEGGFTGERLFVLTSIKDVGPGFRVIETFTTEDGRQILVDRGYVREGEQTLITTPEQVQITGNLHWPDEAHSSTPEPDGTLWFAREVDAMSEALGTEPVLVVVASSSVPDPVLRPLAIDTSGIPNDHLNYAITWFLMAAVWAVMTGAFAWQMRGGNTKEQGN